jgi:O-antigen ligase
MTPPTLGWLAYFTLALIVTAVAAAVITDPLLVPKKGLGKITKLLWFAAIPLCSAQVCSVRRFRATLLTLVAGGCVLSAYVLLGETSFAWLQVHYPAGEATTATPAFAALLKKTACTIGLDKALCRWFADEVWSPWGGRPPCFLYALTFNATLHNAQRLMVALVCAVAAAMERRDRAALKPLLAWAPFLIAAGLVVTCKRAPLLGAIFATGLLLAILSRPWKALAAVLAICALAVAVPQSRARLQMLPMEFDARNGGRALMWTRIAPQIHREHPWGIGFRSLTDKKMRSIDWHVEPNRTHLHSTPLQAFIDCGWAGLAVWLAWMALSFRSAIATAKGRGGAAGLPQAARAAPLAALAALAGVALVEYNIADAAVVLLYGSVLGLSAPALPTLNG